MADKKDVQIAGISTILNTHAESIKMMSEELKLLNRTLIINTEHLANHIKRTDQNEEMLGLYKHEMQTRLKPLEDQSIFTNKMLKVSIWFLGLPACAYYVIKIAKEFLGR